MNSSALNHELMVMTDSSQGDLTHHPADGTTDGVGLELAVEATGHLVDLQTEEAGRAAEAEANVKIKPAPDPNNRIFIIFIILQNVGSEE